MNTGGGTGPPPARKGPTGEQTANAIPTGKGNDRRSSSAPSPPHLSSATGGVRRRRRRPGSGGDDGAVDDRGGAASRASLGDFEEEGDDDATRRRRRLMLLLRHQVDASVTLVDRLRSFLLACPPPPTGGGGDVRGGAGESSSAAAAVRGLTLPADAIAWLVVHLDLLGGDGDDSSSPSDDGGAPRPDDDGDLHRNSSPRPSPTPSGLRDRDGGGDRTSGVAAVDELSIIGVEDDAGSASSEQLRRKLVHVRDLLGVIRPLLRRVTHLHVTGDAWPPPPPPPPSSSSPSKEKRITETGIPGRRRSSGAGGGGPPSASSSSSVSSSSSSAFVVAGTGHRQSRRRPRQLPPPRDVSTMPTMESTTTTTGGDGSFDVWHSHDDPSLARFLSAALEHWSSSILLSEPHSSSSSSDGRPYAYSYRRPRVDMSKFPNTAALILDCVEPECVCNLDAVGGSLRLLRVERGCIYDVERFLFPPHSRRSSSSSSSVDEGGEEETPGVWVEGNGGGGGGGGERQAINGSSGLAAPAPDEVGGGGGDRFGDRGPGGEAAAAAGGGGGGGGGEDNNSHRYPLLTHIKLFRCALGELSGLRGGGGDDRRRRRRRPSPNDPVFPPPPTPPPISRLKNLTSLNLSNNDIVSTRTAFAGLADLPSLERIDLSYNRLSDLEGVHLLVGNVKTLLLSRNRIASCRGGIDRMFSLRFLALDGNRIGRLADVAGLANLPELTGLALGGNPIAGGGGDDDLEGGGGVRPGNTGSVVKVKTATAAVKKRGGYGGGGSMDRTYRVEVFNLFRESRSSFSPPVGPVGGTMHRRQVRALLPVLDGRRATATELSILDELTFGNVVVVHPAEGAAIPEANAAPTGPNPTLNGHGIAGEVPRTAAPQDVSFGSPPPHRLVDARDGPFYPSVSSTIVARRPSTHHWGGFRREYRRRALARRDVTIRDAPVPAMPARSASSMGADPTFCGNVMDDATRLPPPRGGRRQFFGMFKPDEIVAATATSSRRRFIASSVSGREMEGGRGEKTRPVDDALATGIGGVSVGSGGSVVPNVDDALNDGGDPLPPTLLSPSTENEMSGHAPPPLDGESSSSRPKNNPLEIDAVDRAAATPLTNGGFVDEPSRLSPLFSDDVSSDSDSFGTPEAWGDEGSGASVKTSDGTSFEKYEGSPRGSSELGREELDQSSSEDKRKIDSIGAITSGRRESWDDRLTIMNVENGLHEMHDASRVTDKGAGGCGTNTDRKFRAHDSCGQDDGNDAERRTSGGGVVDAPKRKSAHCIAPMSTRYDGPSDYSSLLIWSNLDLYFRVFVFPPVHKLISSHDEQHAIEGNGSSISEEGPRIQLNQHDQKALCGENGVSKCNAAIEKPGSSYGRSNHHHHPVPEEEKFVSLWREYVLPCGEASKSRVAPVLSPRRGFHGELIKGHHQASGTGAATMSSEARTMIVCLSDRAIYFIPEKDRISPDDSCSMNCVDISGGGDDATVMTKPADGVAATCRSMIPTSALFESGLWPRAAARHGLGYLHRITIGFGFQRLTLHFRVPVPPASDGSHPTTGGRRHRREASSSRINNCNGEKSGGITSDDPTGTSDDVVCFSYVLLTCNKRRTISMLQDIQSHAKDNTNHMANEGTSAVTDYDAAGDATVLDNDDKNFLDCLYTAVAPTPVGVVMHYQVLKQRWKRGDRDAVRRIFVLTDRNVFLLDEDYVGDGGNDDDGATIKRSATSCCDQQQGRNNDGSVRLRCIDSADLLYVTEVRAADEDPRCITLVSKAAGMLKRSHKWRLICRDGEGAEQLVEDVRRAMIMEF